MAHTGLYTTDLPSGREERHYRIPRTFQEQGLSGLILSHDFNNLADASRGPSADPVPLGLGVCVHGCCQHRL